MAAGPKKRSEDYDVVEGDHGTLGLIVLAGVGRILDGTILKYLITRKNGENRPNYAITRIFPYKPTFPL